jgi:hypothetical protein
MYSYRGVFVPKTPLPSSLNLSGSMVCEKETNVRLYELVEGNCLEQKDKSYLDRYEI